MSSKFKQFSVQLITVLLLLAPASTSLAQDQSIDFTPYASYFAGAPLTSEYMGNFYQVHVKIRQLQANHGPKNLLKMKYEAGNYAGIRFMKQITFKVPHDEEYYQPMWIRFDEFDLHASNATKLYHKLLKTKYLLDIMDGEFGYFKTPNTPENVTFKYKTAPFKGKVRNSPYSYKPEKKEDILIEMIIETDRPKNTAIAEIIATRWCVFHQLNRAYQDLAYNVLLEYLKSNDLPSAFVRDGEDLSLLDPILEEVLNYELPQYQAFNLVTKKPLGKFPAFEANVIDLSLFKDPSATDVFSGKRIIDLEFGKFEGDFILSKIVKGVWTSNNGRVRIVMDFDKNENPIHVQYHGSFLDYFAFYDENSDYLRISRAMSKEGISRGGTLATLSGQIGEKENTDYAYSVNELSGMMDEAIEKGNLKFSVQNSFRITASPTEVASSVLGNVDFSLEKNGDQTKLVAKSRKGKTMTLLSSENGLSTAQEIKVNILQGYSQYLAKYLPVFNEVKEPEYHPTINYSELVLLLEDLHIMRDLIRKEQIHPMGMAVYISRGYGISKDPGPYFIEFYDVAAKFQESLKLEIELIDYYLSTHPNSEKAEEIDAEKAIILEGIQYMDEKLKKYKGSMGSNEMLNELSIIYEEDYPEVEKIINSWRMN